MHFEAPPPLSKMFFEYQAIIFNGKKSPKIFTNATVRPGAGDPPPLTVSLTVKYPGFFDGFPKLKKTKFPRMIMVK